MHFHVASIFNSNIFHTIDTKKKPNMKPTNLETVVRKFNAEIFNNNYYYFLFH